MTGPAFRYTTPTAFRSALKERFGQIARTDRRYRLDELQRPESFVVPDVTGWAARYPKVAAEAPGPAPDFAAAAALASKIFDPILGRTAIGRWSPSSRSWAPD